MSTISLFSNAVAGSNSTNSTMPELITADDWKALAQHVLCDGDGTSAMDPFCSIWMNNVSSTGVDNPPHVALWNHAITKVVGWVVVLLLKSVFLEQAFDRWSGPYRFLNVGSTLIPFGLALWTMLGAFGDIGDGESGSDESLSKYDAFLVLGKHIATTPKVVNWVFTAIAWRITHRVASRHMRSSKILSAIEWMPGMMAALLSSACWILGETTVTTMLLGELNSNALLLSSKLIQYGSNTVTGWYGYAYLVNAMLGTNRCTSFSWFVVVAMAGKFALSGGLL